MTAAFPVDLPLTGIRVLSLAEQYPGPYATMLLADLGAEVTLLERPRGGDPTRRFSGHYLALSRNKKSVAVDLKTDAGRAVFWTLVADSDVVIEGFRPGTMARLGLDAAAVRQRFSDVIYVSISSFGQSGPYGSRGGHDITMQGMAGLVDAESRRPGSLPLADLSSAMFAAFATVSALLGRVRGGGAATVDVSMLDCLLSWRGTMLVSALNGLDPAPYPPEDPGYGVFETSDGSLITLSIAGEDHQWSALCAAVGLPDYACLTTVARERRAGEITPRLRNAIRGTPWPELRARLAEGGVGFGPVNTDVEALANDQVTAREIVVRIPGSEVQVLRQPVLFDGAGGRVRGTVPALGEHTAEVLRAHGYSADDLARMAAAGEIAVNATEAVAVNATEAKEERPC
jgi:crotonobetainyl-CoA:carnitine CoA-transferase CaiB-like acyl-CoA transferase